MAQDAAKDTIVKVLAFQTLFPRHSTYFIHVKWALSNVSCFNQPILELFIVRIFQIIPHVILVLILVVIGEALFMDVVNGHCQLLLLSVSIIYALHLQDLLLSLLVDPLGRLIDFLVVARVSIVVLIRPQLVESLLQVVRLDLVSLVEGVSPLPLDNVESGEEDTENYNASEEHSEALKCPERAVVLKGWITGTN